MAKAGDIIENPARGARIVFLQTAEETEGRLLKIEVGVAPRSLGAGADHVHPMAEERFTVLEGKVRVWVDGIEGLCTPDGHIGA